jgi:signal peptidase I
MGSDVHPGPLSAEAPNSEGDARDRAPRWRDYLEAVLVAVVFALFVRTFLFQAFVVPTPSMEPNILVGDHLIVNKFIYAPRAVTRTRLLPHRPVRQEDVVVFKFPEDPRRDFIKRVVALPGQTVEIRDKALYVDGARQAEPRVMHSERRVWPDDPNLPDTYRYRDQFGPVRVPPDSYFALGDNRDVSRDSRFWGAVPATNLKGRALFVYWSFARDEKTRGNLFRRAADFFRRTRWKRTFLPVS